MLSGERVVFHHVPKCGGTSLTRALMRRYILSFASLKRGEPVHDAMQVIYPAHGFGSSFEMADRFRCRMAALYMERDVKLIYGHFPFSEVLHENYSDRYRFITLLREPVALFISTFFWNVTSPEERWQIHSTLEAFLDSPRARQFGSLYSAYFGGDEARADPGSMAAVEAAKRNLRKFNAVGLVENMPSFQRRLRDVLGVNVRIGHKNRARTGSPSGGFSLSEEMRQRIVNISAPNTEIYEFAKSEIVS